MTASPRAPTARERNAAVAWSEERPRHALDASTPATPSPRRNIESRKTQALAEADPRDCLGEEKPPLAALVRVLDRGHAESKREAARALYALATDSAEVRERLLFHHDAVLPLERLLDASDAKARV